MFANNRSIVELVDENQINLYNPKVYTVNHISHNQLK